MDSNEILKYIARLIMNYPKIVNALDTKDRGKAVWNFFNIIFDENHKIAVLSERDSLSQEKFKHFFKKINNKENGWEKEEPSTDLESIFIMIAKTLNVLSNDENKFNTFFHKPSESIPKMNLTLFISLITHYTLSTGEISYDDTHGFNSYTKIYNIISNDKCSASDFNYWQLYYLWLHDIINTPAPSADNIPPEENIALFEAIKNCNTEFVSDYVKAHGKNVKKMNTQGYLFKTPLYAATEATIEAKNDNLIKANEIVKSLLKAKATNINKVSAHGDTVVHFATRRNLFEILSLFFDAEFGKKPDLSLTSSGLTPLGVAFGNNNKEIATYLLGKGAVLSHADVNMTITINNNTITLRDQAAKFGLSEAIEKLIESRANSHEKDSESSVKRQKLS